MFKTVAVRTCTFLAAMFLFSNLISAQTNQNKTEPSDTLLDEKPERVVTEEVKLNVLARNDAGHFDPSLIMDDLMVVEDRTPHSIVSLRRVPASVLVVLDTGGELRLAKNLKTTRDVALNLIRSLSDQNSIAVMQYSDKPEILSEWTTDKAQIVETILKKTNFGRRSNFVDSMNLAARFLEKRPNENRHLVLITDGTDSAKNNAERDSAFRNLLAANVSIHVLSYTALEQQENAERSVMVKAGEGRIPQRTPEEHKITLPGAIQTMMNFPRLGGINLDREMLKAAQARRDALKQSQSQLTTLATDAGGEIFLPTKLEEMPAQAREVAGIIDSNYVVTYVPKRSLANAPAGEIREIAVVSRRVGLIVQARRKFVVPKQG